jgi:hypothetical protein
MLASSTSLELVVTAWRGDSTDDHWAAARYDIAPISSSAICVDSTDRSERLS